MEVSKLFILTLVVATKVEAKQSPSSFGSIEYLHEPIASANDSTEASTNLIRFTKHEFGEKKVHRVTDNIYVAIGYALGNSIMIIGGFG